jgi:hypothetical protein
LGSNKEEVRPLLTRYGDKGKPVLQCRVIIDKLYSALNKLFTYDPEDKLASDNVRGWTQKPRYNASKGLAKIELCAKAWVLTKPFKGIYNRTEHIDHYP